MSRKSGVKRNIKPRNPVAQSPLLRKGGAHKKSVSGQRQKQKLETRRLAALAAKPDLLNVFRSCCLCLLSPTFIERKRNE